MSTTCAKNGASCRLLEATYIPSWCLPGIVKMSVQSVSWGLPGIKKIHVCECTHKAHISVLSQDKTKNGLCSYLTLPWNSGSIREKCKCRPLALWPKKTNKPSCLPLQDLWQGKSCPFLLQQLWGHTATICCRFPPHLLKINKSKQNSGGGTDAIN